MPSSIPRPGAPVRGSKSGKPIMALFDLLGRSWALGVIWQLSNGPMTFRQLQESCESVSPTVLNKRLKELKESGVLARGDSGYELTATGRELFTLLEPFGAWAIRWAEGLPADGPSA
ncbi:winged helix-turn-helix transcriptional regulator [Denitrobaculum tricleocarpae]|uniref:Helix-turn-helix transcriptional regulator n=1 Tax=Denitrobaculum tricleocarpae TaxID=2591009 RepID=A0A545TPJ4_9PROT|nr:helix-turn-helix domain-containing protein [Denitrobaculum tricleocarpae]TQV79146.1 helix-turn-helix transcriptional regulator [Denitrobaculum tricleocarpae]